MKHYAKVGLSTKIKVEIRRTSKLKSEQNGFCSTKFGRSVFPRHDDQHAAGPIGQDKVSRK